MPSLISKTVVLAAVSLAGLSAANSPADVQTLNPQARAFLRQARASDNATGLEEASRTVEQALRSAPDNLESRRLAVELLLAQHRFAEALEQARKLNHSVPDDIAAWGLVSDAALGLGDYAEAERSAQWMIRLRATNIGGLERGARLRELFGDLDGARELWQSAMRLAPAGEEHDWILTQMASLDRRTGHAVAAISLLQEVLRSQPGYQPALAEMARVEMDRRNYAKAAEMLAIRYHATHRPDAQYELARALEMAGRTSEAAAQYREFESAALAVSQAPYNYNHQLTFFYVDREEKPKEALRIAAREAAKRQDVATLDAYAWALCADGQLPEAGKQIAKVLSVGVHEPDVLYRAGVISAKLNDASAASRYFTQSLAVSSESVVADAVRAALKELGPHAD
ncbi:MAG: hypothetical protein U0Q18_13375 [Bryobacteraceae bacterium]